MESQIYLRMNQLEIRQKYSIIFVFAMTYLLASCSSDFVAPNPNFPADGVIRVAAGVDELISRSGQDGANLTLFNLSIGYPDYPAYSHYACMKKEQEKWNSYSAENDGTTPLVMNWKDDKTPIYVTALCVNNKNRKSEAFISESIDSVEIEQNTLELVKASDILYMPKTEITPNDATYFTSECALNLKLRHFLSKLKIKLTLGADFFTGDLPVISASEIKSVQVYGTKTKFKWTPSVSSSFSLVDGSDHVIKPCYEDNSFNPMENKKMAIYECIVVPQFVTKEVFSVQFGVKGTPYELKLPNDLLFEGDTVYTISVTVNKVKPSEIGKISVSKWASGPDKFL